MRFFSWRKWRGWSDITISLPSGSRRRTRIIGVGVVVVEGWHTVRFKYRLVRRQGRKKTAKSARKSDEPTPGREQLTVRYFTWYSMLRLPPSFCSSASPFNFVENGRARDGEIERKFSGGSSSTGSLILRLIFSLNDFLKINEIILLTPERSGVTM